MAERGEGAAKKSGGGPEIVLALAGLLSFAAGAGLAHLLGYGEASIGSGLVCLFVVGAAVAVPGPVSYKAGVASAVVATVGLLIAELGTGSPVLAGIAMAVVCLLTSLSFAGGKIAKVVGLMLGTAYFLPAALGLVDGIDGADVAELGAVGLGAGLVIAISIATVRRFTSSERVAKPAAFNKPEAPSSFVLMWNELRAFGPDARSGIRRALMLGVVMGAYQAEGNHNLFWILLTMYIVLQPDIERTWNKALSRSAGTLAGALLVGALGQILPNDVMVALGLLALCFGLAWYRSSYTIYAACVTFLAVAIYGAESGSFLTWAGLRVADTLIGVMIALLGTYFIFPIRETARSRQ